MLPDFVDKIWQGKMREDLVVNATVIAKACIFRLWWTHGQGFNLLHVDLEQGEY